MCIKQKHLVSWHFLLWCKCYYYWMNKSECWFKLLFRVILITLMPQKSCLWYINKTYIRSKFNQCYGRLLLFKLQIYVYFVYLMYLVYPMYPMYSCIPCILDMTCIPCILDMKYLRKHCLWNFYMDDSYVQWVVGTFLWTVTTFNRIKCASILSCKEFVC